MTSSYAYPQPHGRSSRRVWNLIAALSLATSAWWTAQGQPPTVEAAGTISGAAFLDYNQDGLNNTSAGVGLPAVDQGVAGVQVRAYDSAGAPQGNATTGADGTYALVTTGIGPYRVEFTLPAGYLPSGEGADNGTTVQFVPNGGGTANLGLTIPSQYCQNNPLQCTPRFVNGQASTGSLVGNTEGLVAFPEDSTSATGAGMITTTLASNIGATWGVAWQRSSNSLFAGALAKRYTSFGPGGSDAIYKITVDPDTGVASATSVFVNLTTLTGGPADTGTITGRDLVNNSFGTPSYDADAFAKTGKIALGDLELSDDGNTLYVVSLTDRTLYALAIGPTGTAPTSTVGTPITLPAGATACAAADLRPWALEVQGASVFVGVVCSAESSANRANLRAYVLELNGSAFDLVAEFPLNYPRGCATNESSTCFPAEWQPWRDTASTVCGDGGSCVQPYGKQIIYPQPILADIEVDRDGALVLGLMDRSGHQWGNNNYGPTSAGTNLTVSFINSATGAVNSTTSLTSTTLYEGVTAGDMVRLCPDGSGGFDSESNATCGSTTTSGAGSSPAQGPGGGEFYWEEMYTLGSLNSGTHNEITNGSLNLIPGRTEIATTVFDPNDDFRAGGIGWFSNADGTRTHSFEIFTQDQTGSLGKAGGLGDIEALCANAPIEIGNRVWVDTDKDGRQDPGESPISGLTVNLFNQAGTQIGTTTTDSDGAWYFGGVANRNLTGGNALAPATAYEVRVPLNQTTLTSNNYSLTAPNVGANGSDSIDSDAVAASGNAVIALTTGGAGANNHTFDIGFTTGLSLGNLVWRDLDNDGQADPAEPGVDGLPVQLLTSTGTPVTSTVTAGGGLYLFTNLTPGDYYVRVTPPNGVCSSSGTPGSGTGPYEGNPGAGQPPDPDNDINNDDNGNGVGTCGQPGYVIESGIITLDNASEPVDDGDGDSFSNLSVDFGLTGLLSLGDLVWIDVNNNGVVDGIETGLNGVAVNLYSGTTLLGTDVTAGGGIYGFSDLLPGDYIVEVVPPSGYCSSTGAPGAMTGTGPYEGPGTPDPDTNLNSDDNGSAIGTCGQGGYVIRSAAVTLAYDDEPINDGDTNANSNLSVDFGLFQPVSLGDLVWVDSDNNGLVNGTETGLNGVTVRLYTVGGALVNTDTTAGGGIYGFTNLAPGDYVVEITPPANYCSSTGTNGSATGPYEGTPGAQPPDPDGNVDDDDNGNGVGTCGQAGYVIRTSAVTLTSGGEPTDDGDTDANSNLTIDFGLTPAVSLGNLVWVDSDNNGLVNGAEAGLNGVTVRLYNAATSTLITTTTTAGGGLYLFEGLSTGAYLVEITPPAGYCSSTGTLGSATGPYEGNPGAGQPPDPDNDINNDDNGNSVGACGTAIRSTPVTLAVGGEPTDDGDADANSNLTIDFGLIQTLSLGNLVWVDTDNNGVVNGSEAGVANVPVRLYTSSGSLLASTTTDTNGLYLFTGLSAGSYFVEITPPAGSCSSTGTPGSGTGPYEGNPGTQPPDPDNDVNDDDNGNGIGTCGQPGYVIRSSDVTLTMDGEPTDDGDTDDNSNLSVDFGLVGNLALGNLVWNDLNNNGLVDGGEPAAVTTTVRLLTTTGTVIATTVTDGSGLYRFQNLLPGDYIVEVVPLPGYCSSTGATGLGTGPYEGTPGTQPPDPDGDVDNDDNGNGLGACGQPGYTIRSTAVTLTTGGEPAGDGDGNTNTNLTIDFGLVLNLSLGDLVWSDANNNGLVDGGEPGVDAVPVRLYTSGGTLLATTTTAGGGLYRFVNLPAGDYIVEIAPPTGACSSSGTVGSGTGPYEGNPGAGQPPDPDNDLNDDDNGNGLGTCGQPGYVVRSSPVTLSAAGEPTDDGDTDANSNLSIDFGLVGTLSLGNLVWGDANNNGSVDGGEAGINSVAVRLYSGSGSLMATTTTSGGGLYVFTNLVPGDYYVEITPPGGYCSSTGTPGSATGPVEGNPGTQPPDPDNDGDNGDDGNGVGACGQPGHVIRSGTITLSIGGEPTGDGDGDDDTNLTIDFGILQPASLGNFVWNDQDSDGVQDPGEPGVGNVTVTLRDGLGATVITTTTASDGTYLFPNLLPGTYSVCFSTIPAGSSLTGANAGGNDATDSDADPADGCTGTYTLTAGGQDLTVDAGLIGVPTAATLTSFTVSQPADGKIIIAWTTAAEVDVFAYRVYRGTTEDFASSVKVCEVAATGPDSAYDCVDTVPGTGPYTYWLTEVNSQGQERLVTDANTVGSAVEHLYLPFIGTP